MRRFIGPCVAAMVLATGAGADLPEIDQNGLGFLFARYAASDGQCQSAFVTRSEARAQPGFGESVTWIGHLRIPDGQARRDFAQPEGFRTYQILGIDEGSGAEARVVHTYAYLREDLDRLLLVRPDRLNARALAGSAGGLFLPGPAERIDPVRGSEALLALSRCAPPPLDAAEAVDEDLTSAQAEDPTRLPMVRVVREVNYRSRPDGSGRRMGSFLRGTVLKVHGLVDGWYRFRVEGEFVYSYEDFFQPVR